MRVKKERKAPRQEASRKNTFLWICLIFFVSAWMFVLGVLVGRGTAPVHFDIEKLQKELADLRATVLEKELKRYKINSPESADKPDLGFHEALKAAEEDTHVGAPESGRKKTEQPKKSLPTQNAKSLPAAGRPAEADVETVGSLTIQVASSKELNFADRMVAQLKAKGYPAYRMSAQITGKGTWHRVRIGRFNTRAEAIRFLDRLKKEDLKGIIVKE